MSWLDGGMAGAICNKCQQEFTIQFVACGAPFPTCPRCGIVDWPRLWLKSSGAFDLKLPENHVHSRIFCS
jgi:hypothetical protein